MDPAEAYIKSITSSHEEYLSSSGPDSPIREAYTGRTVLVTGGGGFLGKHLLEKLFRSCEIKKAYLLLRPKKGKTPKDRIDEILKDSIYDGLRKKRPDFAQKVELIEGDIKELRLGISQQDWHTITDQVEIIFHGAATVNFEEHIKIATLTNVRGTREMVALAQECKKLRSFVHVSTAYTFATRDRINMEVSEQFYTAPVPPRVLIDMVNTVDEQMLDDITPKLIQNWPNTYTFTKAVAEEVIRDASDQLPISIVRPAIVINAYREPVPGWMDPSCLYSASGLVLGGGMGILHIMYSRDSARVDLVPVDYVTNAIIAAGWAASKERKIYTLATARNHLSWGEKHGFLQQCTYKYMTPKLLWHSFVLGTDNQLWFTLMALLWHDIPSYILDGICMVLGKPPTFRKIYSKIGKLNQVLSYFTCNDWNLKDENLLELYNTMSEGDKKVFNFNISYLDWEQQITLWGLGVRRYLLQDDLKDTEFGNKKRRLLQGLHYLVTALYFYTLWCLFWFFFDFLCFFVKVVFFI